MKAAWSFLCLLLLNGGFASAVAETDREKYVTNLPPCDRVVVIRIGRAAPEPEGKLTDFPQGPDAAGKVYYVEADAGCYYIDGQVTLEGVEAEKVAALYRALKRPPIEVRDLPDLISEDELLGRARHVRMYKNSMSAKCHLPPFAYRFYAEDKLLYDTSICWGCENLVVGEKGDRSFLSFRPTEKESVELFNVSNALFPKYRAIPPWERNREKQAEAPER